MNIAKLSINRPIFITCIVATIIILGIISLSNMGLDLLPDTTFPAVSVTTTYPGAAPEEIAQQITNPIEEELSSIGGIKHISSQSLEGLSIVAVEFSMDVNIDVASQEVRDKISTVKNKLPRDLPADPTIAKLDPSSDPVMRIAVVSDLPPAELYDIVKEKIKPRIERVKQIGSIAILGGTRREIQVNLDQKKLDDYRISTSAVVAGISNSGTNVAIGKKEQESGNETVFRAIGQYTDLSRIENTLISFSGDLGNSVSVKNLGTVTVGVEDEENRAYIYYPSPAKEKNSSRRRCVFIDIKKQAGANTVSVIDDVQKKITSINESLKTEKGNTRIITVYDDSKWIRVNVEEVMYSILAGIFLAVVVVFLFLGNFRSTIITCIAIPNSLLGAFIIMSQMGFTLNLISLMALSLTVGLLVDDAIVVRENIFRKLEAKMHPFDAAEKGTTEVMLAVIATTLAIMAVFIPVGTLSGMAGQMLRQFGLTIVFAMAISLFDALTVAPFLSAHFAGTGKKEDNAVVRIFEKLQEKLDRLYTRIMQVCLAHPLKVLLGMLLVFTASIASLQFVKMTFMAEADDGQYSIKIKMPSGTSLAGTEDTLKKIETKIRTLKDLDFYAVTVGNDNGDPTEGKIDILLKKERKLDTITNKSITRNMLQDFAYAHPSVNELRGSSMDNTPYTLILSGNDLKSVENYAQTLMEEIRKIPDLTEIDTSVKPGKPEFRVILDPQKMQDCGIIQTVASNELRYNVTGAIAGKYYINGIEYDVRVRLEPGQRNLNNMYNTIRVPNTTGMMVPLKSIARFDSAIGSSQINRIDKAYIVKITSNLKPDGAIGNSLSRTRDSIEKKCPLPEGISYAFSGQSENFTELSASIVTALLLALLFMYLVLASLYESFITPFTILLAIPPALTGAIISLLVTGEMMGMFAMIGILMLMGLVTKNSILLVDFCVKGVRNGMDRKEAILQAGQKRLRPILMTTFAMIASTIPLALGIGEAAKMRQSMGIAILGGLIASTIITLIVVPAAFEYIDRFREAIESRFRVKPPKLWFKK